MSFDELHTYFPRRLDAPAKFLLWDFDLVAAGAAGFGVGIAVNSFYVGCFASVLCFWGYSELKGSRHPGYGLHYLYWHTPIKTFKRTPASGKRHYVG